MLMAHLPPFFSCEFFFVGNPAGFSCPVETRIFQERSSNLSGSLSKPMDLARLYFPH